MLERLVSTMSWYLKSLKLTTFHTKLIPKFIIIILIFYIHDNQIINIYFIFKIKNYHEKKFIINKKIYKLTYVLQPECNSLEAT
jgi:hypothetical protein